MGRYKILDQHRLNFVTLTVVDWIDVFIRKSHKDIIIESLRYCQIEKGLRVCAYVILKREWFAKKAHSYFVSNQGKKRSRCSASPSIFNAGLMQKSTCSFANHLRLSIL